MAHDKNEFHGCMLALLVACIFILPPMFVAVPTGLLALVNGLFGLSVPIDWRTMVGTWTVLLFLLYSVTMFGLRGARTSSRMMRRSYSCHRRRKSKIT